MAGSFKILAAVDTLENGTTEAVRSATARDRIPCRTTFTIVAGIATVAIAAFVVCKASANVGPENVNEQGAVDVINLDFLGQAPPPQRSSGQMLDESLRLNKDAVNIGHTARRTAMESQKIQELKMKHQQICDSLHSAQQAQRRFATASQLGTHLLGTLRALPSRPSVELVVQFLALKFLPNVHENKLTIDDMCAAINSVKVGIEAAMRNGLIRFSAAPVAAVVVNPSQAAWRRMSQAQYEQPGWDPSAPGSADYQTQPPSAADYQTQPPAQAPVQTTSFPVAAGGTGVVPGSGVSGTQTSAVDAPTATPASVPAPSPGGGDAEIALAQAIAAGMEKIIACVLWAVEGP